MQSKTTLWLFLITAVLAGGLYIAKKKIPTTQEAKEAEKHLVAIKEGDVTGFEIKGIDRNLVFERQDKQWMLKKPIQAKANRAEIGAILSNLEFLERRRTLSARENADSKLLLSDYGLDKPRMTVTFKTKEDQAVIHVGNEAKQGDSVYVQVADSRDINLVDKGFISKLEKKIEDYRDKTLFDFDASQVQRLDIGNGSSHLEFTRTNNVWKITRPLTARADNAKVDEFLRETISLRIEDFLSEEAAAAKEYGLEEPAQEVSLTLAKQDSTQTLLLGSKLKNDAKKVAGKIKGQNTIVSVPIIYSGLVGKPLTDFRDHQLVSYNPKEITEIELHNRQLVVNLKKQGDAWKMTHPEAMDADKDLVEKFLNRLNQAQVREFTTDVITDLDKFGLKIPTSTIVLRGDAGGAFSTNAPASSVVRVDLALGKEDGVRRMSYVKLADESCVYGVESNETDEWPRSALDLRSRVIFEAKKDSLKAATQKKGKGTVGLEFTDGEWKTAKGTQGNIDQTAWQKFVNRLEKFDVEKIVGTALNSTLKQYGLESPVLTWTVMSEVDGKPVTQEVLVGRETSQKKYYILWKSQLMVCEISKETYQIFAANWIASESGESKPKTSGTK